nr:hypothetical protein Itr_chr02CG09980 [Ipomoea trifida]
MIDSLELYRESQRGDKVECTTGSKVNMVLGRIWTYPANSHELHKFEAVKIGVVWVETRKKEFFKNTYIIVEVSRKNTIGGQTMYLIDMYP